MARGSEQWFARDFDTVIVGGGVAGLATAARLQAAGQLTCVLEAHATPGGCAGFFRRRGFAFDAGATTLVDFEPGGVGGELLESIGMTPPEGEALPGYLAWLPDRVVSLHRDREQWDRERLRQFGTSPRHRAFWRLLDRLSDVFWRASRTGVRLPIRTVADVRRGLSALGPRHLPLLRYLSMTMGDLLRRFHLRDDLPLVGLLSMLIEDTVHSTIDEAPAINAALGVTIRGAGLTRADGGMAAFWDTFTDHYQELGGELVPRCRANGVTGEHGAFQVATTHGEFTARQVVAALPITLAAKLGPSRVATSLERFIRRDEPSMGGSVVVFLGVPEEEVAGQEWTHHQILEDYASPLGEGNNMFISVSAAGDEASAPRGFRTVMLSTHCGLEKWETGPNLPFDRKDYVERKNAIGERLIELARRVYPDLATHPVVHEVATPKTFARFTRRPRGAVGGVRLTLRNSNQNAVPHDIGVPGYRVVGDTTWPGLGTVACVLGSRLVAEDVLAESTELQPESNPFLCPGKRLRRALVGAQ